jgi:(E)-4-hydroxy-3-methylbut-2-enyl-diphosphate synthase
LEAIDAGVAKIRLNPGNIGDREQVRRVIAAAASAGVAIRVGVNEGSVVERREGRQREADLAKPLDELMADKMAQYLEIFQEADFHNLIISAKSHDAYTCVAVNRRLAQRWDYPLHLGVTHAGTRESGAIRSAAALGALLAEGIGDTIRISLAGEGVEEVRAACELLASLRLRPREGVEIVACPTCGRTSADVAGIAEQVRAALPHVRRHVRVAVMGCVVNGPGEADEADVAACCGEGKAALYRHGRLVATVPLDALLPGLLEQVQAVLKEEE